MSRPPNPERGGGVPVAIASVLMVLSGNTSVRINTFDVLMVDFDKVVLLLLLLLLLFFGGVKVGMLNVAVNSAVGVESRDVKMRTVEDADVPVGLAVVVVVVCIRVGMVLLLLLGALFHCARRHCFVRALSTSCPF